MARCMHMSEFLHVIILVLFDCKPEHALNYSLNGPFHEMRLFIRSTNLSSERAGNEEKKPSRHDKW